MPDPSPRDSTFQAVEAEGVGEGENFPPHQIDGAIRLAFQNVDCIAYLSCRCGEPFCSKVHDSVIAACDDARGQLSAHIKKNARV